MNRSETVGKLVAALAMAQQDFGVALKDSNNPFYSSKYADLSSVIGAVRPALNKHGIALVQLSTSDLERRTASVTTSLHLGDEWIAETAEAPAVGKGKDGADKFDAQTLGAAWTYLRRYTLQGFVAIPAEDDDGNSIQGNHAPVQSRQPARQPAATITPEMEREYRIWQDAFAEADTVESFNATIVPLMKERSKDFIKAAAQIAKERGWRPNRSTGLYEVA